MRRIGGFSLLELLIVVAIILIIATIAVPSLLQARRTANETAAVANLKTLNTAEANYSVSGGGSFASLTDLIAGGLLDSGFATTKGGYNYILTLSPDRMNYTAVAAATSNFMGRYDYYALPDYVVRFSTVTGRAPAGEEGQPAK